MSRTPRILCFFGFLAAALCQAATPKLAGKLTFDAPVVEVSASADGHMLIVQTSQGTAGESRLRVMELTDGAAHYERRGSLVLEGRGTVSLSPDGKRALLLVSPEQQTHDKATRRVVLDLDFSRPDSPLQVQRWEFVGRKVVVAPDASAYAVSEPAAKEGRWQTQVFVHTAGWKPTLLEETEYAEIQDVSALGRYVVYSKFGQELESIDLSSKPPVRYAQPYTFMSRHDCILAVLSGGQTVVEDSRMSRIGVYAPKKNLPRVGVLQHEGKKYCHSLNPNLGSAGLLFAAYQGEIARIDLGTPDAPELRQTWRLPPSFHPLAATPRIVLASKEGAPNELNLFQLDAVSDAKVNWIALDTQYQQIIAKYQADVKAKRGIPYYDPVLSLEKGGVLHAIDENPEGLSLKQAAAILNDYGFLAAQMRDRNALAERALKRAIALDPKRALAYLNLADLQHNSLSTIGHWAGKKARWREAAENYRLYLSFGGKTSEKISAFLRGDLRAAKANDFCGAIANYANAGRLGELVSDSGIGLPADGRKVDLFFSTQGTAHVPVIYAFDSRTDESINEDNSLSMPPSADSLWGGDSLGLLVYRNGPHILHYRDLQHPVSSVSLVDGSICEFVADVKESVGVDAVEPELCRRLQDGSIAETLKFDGPVWMTNEDVSKQWGETGISGTRAIDFANNGKHPNVAQLGLVSGAGAGCDETFYELVDGNATKFVSGPTRDLLMKLQGADPSNRYPILPCGNQPSFFQFNGKTYFENKPGNWPPVDAWHQYHRVARVDDGRVTDVCQFKFRTQIAVKAK